MEEPILSLIIYSQLKLGVQLLHHHNHRVQVAAFNGVLQGSEVVVPVPQVDVSPVVHDQHSDYLRPPVDGGDLESRPAVLGDFVGINPLDSNTIKTPPTSPYIYSPWSPSSSSPCGRGRAGRPSTPGPRPSAESWRPADG